MQEIQLTEEEKKQFTLKLAHRFEHEIKQNMKGRLFLISHEGTENLENKYLIQLTCMTYDDAKKEQNQFNFTNSNKIVLEGNPQYVYYHLYRHFRNCASHPVENIKKFKDGENEYYHLKDFFKERNKRISMNAWISVDIFFKYVDDIYDESVIYKKRKR